MTTYPKKRIKAKKKRNDPDALKNNSGNTYQETLVTKEEHDEEIALDD